MGGGGGGSGGGSRYRPNKNGYYGRKGQSATNSRVRNMPGGKHGAKDFFDNISRGFSKETKYPNGTIVKTMPDGSSITYRPISISDGTPTVTINGGSYKYQHIHFID